MAGLSHIWSTSLFQAAGTTQGWIWQIGEQQDYWGFCVRPWQANSDAAVVSESTTTNNDLNYFQTFTITTGSGGLMRFSAIRVAGS
jgi:hypothetical protein